MKSIGLFLFATLITITTFAQGLPKPVEKARKAVFSIVTYKDNKLLNSGNGFFISEDGVGVSDYGLFKGADKAVVIATDGKEYPVELIQGANELYDVVKFSIQKGKKMPYLTKARRMPAINETIYVLPYATQKSPTNINGKIAKADSLPQGSLYYTLDFASTEKDVSCPIVNAEGEVTALLQKGNSGNQSFAIGIGYAENLTITPLSINDVSLNNIHIAKAFPNTEDQALVYLYLASTTVDDTAYLQLLNRFIATYPQSSEGYLRRATHHLSQQTATSLSSAEADLKKVLETADNKADAYYDCARVIYNYNMALEENKKAPEGWEMSKAQDFLRNAIAGKELAVYHQLQGDIHFAEKQYPEATVAYEKAARLQPSAAVYYAAARSKELTEGTNRKEVVALLDSAVAQYVTPYPLEAATYIYERARVKNDAEMYREAVADYNTFQQLAGDKVTAQFYLIRAQAEMKCRMYAQAVADMEKAVTLAPADSEAWTEKGSVHLRVNQREEAIKSLEKAIALDNKNATAYRMLGYIQVENKQKTQGISNLQRASELGDNVATDLLKKYNN